MKKPIVIALIAGAAATIPAYLLIQKLMKKKNTVRQTASLLEEPPTGAPSKPEIQISETPMLTPSGLVSPSGLPLYNFKDEHNLIFCDETQLGKRLIQLENSINIRDIGGYTGSQGRKVKWRKVIRSEELAHLSDSDVEYFSDLKLKHVFDFRNESKAKRTADRLPEATEYHLLPIFNSLDKATDGLDFKQPGTVDLFMREIYKVQTEERAQCFAEVLKYLTEPSECPILYHCTNGKDRTGFMTYQILGLLGVKDETILSDYTLTNLTFDESFQLLGTIMSEEMAIDNYQLWEFYGVKPEWLKISMNYVNTKFGNVENYLLEETDLREKDFEMIRANLLV